MKNILVSIDFSDVTDLLIERAADLAKAFGGTVRLLHVAPPDPAFASSKAWPQEVRDQLAKELYEEHETLEVLARRLEQDGVPTKVLMDRGSIVDTILHIASKTESELIMLGSRTHGAFFQLAPRSIVKGIISRSDCPVLVIPQPKKHTEGVTGSKAEDAG